MFSLRPRGLQQLKSTNFLKLSSLPVNIQCKLSNNDISDEHLALSRLSLTELELRHSNIMLHRLLISGVILVIVLGTLCIVKIAGCRLFRWVMCTLTMVTTW